MRTYRGAWALAGLMAGAAGLATSYFAAMAMTIRQAPVVAVAELVIRYTPGAVAERAIAVLGYWDKPVLVLVMLLILGALFAYAGWLAHRSWWLSAAVFGALAAVGALATARQPGGTVTDFLPLAVGFVTWLVVLSLLTEPLQRAEGVRGDATDRDPAVATDEPDEADELTGDSRRGFLLRAGVAAGVALAVAGVGRFIGRGRRQVEETRRLLRLSDVTEPQVPRGARIGVEGIAPWQTSADDFYLIHTAIVVPTVEPRNWKLRIHGMVDREVVLTFDELIARRRTEAWITLNCVSNQVGGELIGNAWWSGVRVADLLAEAGVSAEADAVLQTSEDGWTCGTPLSVLTDDRDAMLAVAMNGKPLSINHGFPVRTIVPGLYGFVSACKWVVDLEVTTFDQVEAYWTGKGWAEQAPVKLASRIDVPDNGAGVPAGDLRVGGIAWSQHTGIAGVELAVDGEEWQPADIAPTPTDDTWVQWAATVTLEPGDHQVRVRATDKDGQVQTGAVQDVLPDGATGWHTIELSAEPG